MFKVKWIERLPHPKKKNKIFKKVHWVMKDGKIAEFAKRQQARQWIRNHAYGPAFIVHPDGTEEDYADTLQTHEECVEEFRRSIKNSDKEYYNNVVKNMEG